MEIKLCTIGFAGKTAQEFFALLQNADVRKLIDIRLNRGGQLAGFAKYPDIAFLLDRVAGIEYQHEPALAPTPELLKSYRKDRDWPRYESAFLALMNERGVPERITPRDFEGAVAMLCSEPGPERCHRRLAADLLAEHWRANHHHVEIHHLVAAPRAKSKSAKRRKKKGSELNDASSD